MRKEGTLSEYKLLTGAFNPLDMMLPHGYDDDFETECAAGEAYGREMLIALGGDPDRDELVVIYGYETPTGANAELWAAVHLGFFPGATGPLAEALGVLCVQSKGVSASVHHDVEGHEPVIGIANQDSCPVGVFVLKRELVRLKEQGGMDYELEEAKENG
jgi:hypothetical protein